MTDYQDTCTILHEGRQKNTSCALVEGNAGQYELAPGVLNDKPFFTLFLPENVIVHPGEKAICKNQEYLVHARMTDTDENRVYWAVLTMSGA